MSDEYQPDWNEGQDMEKSEKEGDGIKVEINGYALERIEAAATVGVRQELAKRIDKIINDTIWDVVEERLSAMIGELAEKSINEYLAKPRQKTNSWGEPMAGQAVAFSELIPAKVESWLSEKVRQSDGKRDDGYDRKGSTTRLDWIVNNYVRDELNVATKAAAEKVTEQAKKVVASHVGKFVAEQMIPQIELNGAERR